MSASEYTLKRTSDTEYIATVRENLRALVEALDDLQNNSRGFDTVCRNHGLNPHRARQTCQRSCVANMKSELYGLERNDYYEADGYERLYADVFELSLAQLADYKLPPDYQDTIDNILWHATESGKISTQEQTIVDEYYGLGLYEPKPAVEIAKKYGVSRQWIYQEIRHVWKVLRRPENFDRLKSGTADYCKKHLQK